MMSFLLGDWKAIVYLAIIAASWRLCLHELYRSPMYFTAYSSAKMPLHDGL